MKDFVLKQDYLNQYSQINWITENENFEKELEDKFNAIMGETYSKAMKKAKLFEMIANEAPIAVDKEDIFQDKLFSGDLILKQKYIWQDEIIKEHLKEKHDFIEKCREEYGLFTADADYGHTSPNSKLLLEIGFGGLYARLDKYCKRDGLTEKQADFYETCKITLKSIETVINRLANAIKPYNEENYIALKNISWNAPKNSYEAMQLLIVYFFINEYVYGTRVRTLGRLDVLLQPFYEKDIKNGVYTKEEIKNMLKFFLNKFWLAKVDFDLPFALSGMDENGNDVTNDMSYLIVETYNELNIYSPKIHIKVCEKTPKKFVKLVLDCIRGGNSSFVFVNDEVGVKSLVNVGIEEKDARNYVPIGCYEPAVWGVEIGCTGNAGLSLVKALELVMTKGCDNATGTYLKEKVGEINSFEDFLSEIKKQIKFYSDYALDYVSEIEKYYGEINPEAILSSMYDHSVETGVDVFEGGAKYNNSSIYFYGIATLVDSLIAVKKIVFEKKLISYEEFCEVLKNDWQGHEDLRDYALNSCPKYGNNNSEADELMIEFSDYVSDISNNKPNGRGGVFKTALFSIDLGYEWGKRTMATPDGRCYGEPWSKNLCASFGKDTKGITALINSVTKMDLSKFPTGSVLDVVLHPTGVRGDEGLEAFYAILRTYFNKGGFAMHGNVFDVETLKEAQKNPEKYKNLQVRLCGWNVYFVNLTKQEQDSFIAQAK